MIYYEVPGVRERTSAGVLLGSIGNGGSKVKKQCIGVEVAECGCHFLYDRIKGLIISYYCIILQCNLVGLLTAKDQGECFICPFFSATLS